MIIKLTTATKNEAVYVNFDFVRLMRKDGSCTELTMSDDKYHRVTVVESPEDIYEMLYPTKPCQGGCHCHEAVEVLDSDVKIVAHETIVTESKADDSAIEPEVKKSATKKKGVIN